MGMAIMPRMPITNFDELYTALNQSFSGQISVLRTELIEKIESEIGSVRKDLISEIGSVRKDLSSEIESVRNDLSSEIGSVRKDLMFEIGSVRNDLSSEIGSVRSDLSSEIESVRKDLSSEIGSVRNDLKADIAKLGAQMAAMEWELLDRIRIEYDVDSVKQNRLDALEKRVTALEQKIA